IAFPMPRPAPVTTATRSVNCAMNSNSPGGSGSKFGEDINRINGEGKAVQPIDRTIEMLCRGVSLVTKNRGDAGLSIGHIFGCQYVDSATVQDGLRGGLIEQINTAGTLLGKDFQLLRVRVEGA